jgi:HlyD family secretion protein
LKPRVSNEDIGYLKVGQPVEVKVDTFPFQRYGSLKGTLISISPDAEDKNAASRDTDTRARASSQQSEASRDLANNGPNAGYVYKVHVRTEESHFVVDGEPRPVGSGMTVQADITTDRRRVIDLFLSPVVNRVAQAVSVPLLLISCVASISCSKHRDESGAMSNPSVSPGTRSDASSDYQRLWPGRPALFKLKDNLILAIPPQFQQFWRQKDEPRAPMAAEQIPTSKLVGFHFFLPNFSGYTPQNYKNDFDENKVDVVEVAAADPSQAVPDSPGYYPPNMIKRMLVPPLNESDYQEMYGLKCYPGILTRLICYGRRDPVSNENILLQVDVPPYGPATRFPLIQAHYFTPLYGGLTVAWRTNAKNLSQWREIDMQIWKFIASWNVANSADINVSR